MKDKYKIKLILFSTFALLGLSIYIPVLKWFAGPTYTTSPNQDAIMMLFLGWLFWIIVAAVLVIISVCTAPKKLRWVFFLISLLFGILGVSMAYFLSE